MQMKCAPSPTKRALGITSSRAGSSSGAACRHRQRWSSCESTVFEQHCKLSLLSDGWFEGPAYALCSRAVGLVTAAFRGLDQDCLNGPAPLPLILLRRLLYQAKDSTWRPSIWVGLICDGCTTILLRRLSRRETRRLRARRQRSSPREMQDDTELRAVATSEQPDTELLPTLVALSYLLSPANLASLSTMPLIPLQKVLTVASIYALEHRLHPSLSSILLCTLSLADPWVGALLSITALSCRVVHRGAKGCDAGGHPSSPSSNAYRDAMGALGEVAAAAIGVWMVAPYCTRRVEIEPNVGAWWYLVVETFQQFLPYFRLIFTVHPFLHALPLAIRLGPRALPVLTGALAVLTAFRPDPTMDRLSLLVSLALVHSDALARMRMRTVLVLGLLVAGVLMPVMRYLWLHARAGNANYLYFQTLVWGVFLSLAVLEFVSALVKSQKAERQIVDQSTNKESKVLQSAAGVSPLHVAKAGRDSKGSERAVEFAILSG